MATIKQTIDIAATPEHIWQRLSDVERWPDWTPSVYRVDILKGPLALGARVRIEQPRLRPAVWTVVHWQPGERFTWSTRSPGLSLVADHQIRRHEAHCSVEFQLTFGGLFGRIAQHFFDSITRQYLLMEAEGLQVLCERPSAC